MKKIHIIIGFIFIAATAMSQGINYEKMNRDLEVAETILKGLIDNKQNQVFWLGREKQIDAQYLEGYGVLITIPIEKNVFEFNMAKVYRKWPEVSDAINYAIEDLESAGVYRISEQQFDTLKKVEIDDVNKVAEERQKQSEYQQKHWEERQRELEEKQHDIEERARSFALRTLKSLNADSVNTANYNKNLENIKVFMLDYGHIISHLKDEDKIKIISKGQNNKNYYYRTENGRMEQSNDYNEFSAEIKMKDVRAFQKGDLSKEEAESRIKINNKNEEKPLAKDIAVFKSIMDRLYKSDLSETYYLKSGISHEEIEALGIIIYLEMASSQRINDYFSMPTQGNQKFSQSERDEKVKAIYPQFEEELINNILEYGKNISSLGEDDKLIFKVNITECNGCGIPENLEIQIDSKTLKYLKSGKMDEKAAKKELKVVQGNMQ